MKKVKIIALLCALILCLTLALTACKDGDPNVITNEWWTTTGELQFNEDGSVNFPNVTIKLVTVVSGDDRNTFSSLIQRFNLEYRGKINIVVENESQSNFESIVAQRVSSKNNAPDLIMSHQKGHRYFAENKIIQPFDPELMEQSGIEIDLDKYSEGLTQYSSLGYEDRIFSIPCDAQSMVVVYNKEQLAELGKELPTNHQELLEVCDAYVKKYGKNAIAWPAGDAQKHFYNYVVTTAIMQNGGELYDADTKRANWTATENAQAFTNAITSLRDLVASDGTVKYAPFDDNIGREVAQENFIKDEALFLMYYPWLIGNMEELYRTQHAMSQEQFEQTVGYTSMANWFAMDPDSDDAGKIFVDSHFFAMSRLVEDINKKAAILEFIRWFTQNIDICTEWAKAGHITACKAVSETEEYKNDAYCQRFINEVYPNIDNFVCMGLTSHYNTVLSYVEKLGRETLVDPQSSIIDKLTRIQREFNDEIDLNEI